MNLSVLVGRGLQLLAKDARGQDLIEYALMAGFAAVAAGAILPSVSTSVSMVFSDVASALASAATGQSIGQ